MGVGNYLAGDDAIGPRVVEQVALDGLEGDFEAVDLSTDVLALVAYLNPDTEAVLVVDAARMGLAPGDFRFFTPDEVQTCKEPSGLTTHESDVLNVLQLARQAGFPIPRVVIMGVEPCSVAAGLTLSGVLAERLPGYASAAVECLARL